MSAELHTMPNGTAVWFEEERHAYYPAKEDGGRGRRCLGVTTPAKRYDGDPGALLKWAAETGYLGIAELASESIKSDVASFTDLQWLTSQQGIVRKLNQAGLDFESVRNRKGRVGTNVHEMALGALAEGVPVPDLDAMTEEERGYAKAVIDFWLEHEPLPSEVEQVLYSERLNVAGRADLRCTLKGHDGPGVIDAKTGFISESAHIQVGGGYPTLFRDAGFGDCNWAYLLSLHEDGTYDLLPAHGTQQGFEMACLIHKDANRIKRESRNDRERAKADKQLAREIDAAVANG